MDSLQSKSFSAYADYFYRNKPSDFFTLENMTHSEFDKIGIPRFFFDDFKVYFYIKVFAKIMSIPTTVCLDENYINIVDRTIYQKKDLENTKRKNFNHFVNLVKSWLNKSIYSKHK